MYRKFTADHIFDGYRFLEGGTVLITDACGKVEAILPATEAGEGVQELQGILSPGFINCHCHLDLSHLRGKIPEKTGLVDFVQEVMRWRNSVSEEEQNAAMFSAMEEMHRNGIVGVGDICTGTASLEVKKFSSLKWRNFIEVSGFSNSIAKTRFDAALLNRLAFLKYFPDSELSPHAPYSVSVDLMKMLNQATAQKITTIHNQETIAENELFLEGKGDMLRLYDNLGISLRDFSPNGKKSFMTWLEQFDQTQQIISVHNSFSDTNDIAYAQFREAEGMKLFFCLCIHANQYIEDKLPPVEMFMQQGMQVVLGTDSLASNHSLDLLEEMKVLHQQCNIPLEHLLHWSTVQGARALGMEEELGSFEKGKRPGVLLIKTKDLSDIQSAKLSRQL